MAVIILAIKEWISALRDDGTLITNYAPARQGLSPQSISREKILKLRDGRLR
jgi:hypothetical protein